MITSIPHLFMYILILLLSNNKIHPLQVFAAPTLSGVHPTSSPYSGGTILLVKGEGLNETSGTACQLRLPTNTLVITFTDNTIHNSSTMTCVVPELEITQSSAINNNNNTIQLHLIGGSGYQNITMFDLMDINVTSIRPDWGYKTEWTSVHIYGNGFVNTSSISCSTGPSTVEGLFLNSSTIICHLQPHSVTEQVTIKLYMNGQVVSQISTVEDNVTLFTYFATPPRPSSCIYVPSYAAFLLTFDREVDIGEEENVQRNSIMKTPNCNTIFQDISLALLGNGAHCNWLNSLQRDILIMLGSNTSVRPGSILSLRSDSIRTRYVTYSKHSQGNITLQASPNTLSPQAVLESPLTIPTCGNLTLTGSSSLYAGPVPMLYQWNVSLNESELSGSGELIEVSSIQEALPQGFTEQSSITLLSSSFTDDTAYVITLTIKNYLGLTDSASIALVKHPTTPPALPLLIVIGGTEKTVQPNKEISIETQLVSDCTPFNSSLSYDWRIQAENSTQNGLINIINRDSPFLLIPPLTLTDDNTYVLTASITSEATPTTSSVPLIIHTIPQTIDDIVIQGGSVIAYGKTNSIPLELNIIVFSTQARTLSLYQGIVWSCLNMDSNETCGATNDTQVFVSQSSLQTYIPWELLAPGVYEIAASLTGTTQYRTSQRVVVTDDDDSGSIVYLFLPDSADPVPHHRKLTLRGNVRALGRGAVTWSCIRTTGYAYLNISDHINPNKISLTITNALDSISEDNNTLLLSSLQYKGFSNPVSLVIPEETLLPNNRYKFRLSAGERYAEVDIQTGSPPLAGALHIEPLSEGTALRTLYIMRALHWTDEPGDMPLYYRFGYSLSNNITWLTPIMMKDHIHTLLPLPSNDTNSLLLLLQVFDCKGSMNTVQKRITLSPPIAALQLSVLYEELQSISVDQKRWIQGMASLTAFLSSLTNNVTVTGNVRDFKESSINLGLHLLNTQLPHTKTFTSILLNILSLSVPNTQLSLNTIASLLRGMEIILDSFISTSNSNLFLSRGLSKQEGELILSMYDQLAKYRPQSEINDDPYRIISNQIDASYQRISDKIGLGLCQELETQEDSISLTSQHFGTIKAYYGVPPWNFNISCNSNDCPFSCSNCPNLNYTAILQERVFNEYINRHCSTASPLGNFTSCEGVCIIGTQSALDTHWNGNTYTHHIKSFPLKLRVMNKERDQLRLAVPTFISLYYPQSVSGRIECVHWDNVTEEWSTNHCNTTIVSSFTVECNCEVSKEIAVIDKCPSGYYGIHCNELCPQGSWGEECSRLCRCSQRGTCSQTNGTCDCDPGWTGDNCQIKCTPPHWGKRCSRDCICQNGHCSFIDGSCDCHDGWTGTICNESCSGGSYGKYCSYNCTCRSPEECNPVTGNCTCQTGYTGSTCHNPCHDWYYGLNCSTACNCTINGTSSCDNVNGTCYCLEEWTGEYCDIPIYSPVATAAPEAMMPLWWIAIPALVLLISIILVLIMLILLIKKRGKKKIGPLPSSEDAKDVDKDDENSLTITRSKSLVRVVRRKEREQEGGEIGKFKEPDQMGTKLRWQIIQLLPIEKSKDVKSEPPSDTASEKELQLCLEDSDEFEEEVYPKGVYLEPTSSLKDLRNNFINTNQLEMNQAHFQFLYSDTPGDTIPIDNEEEIQLERFSERERTIYIQAIDKGVTIMELCICGKFAELECTNCRSKGYCSGTCQTEDWPDHIKVCRIMSARRKEEKRQRKQERRERRIEKLNRTGFTPDPDFCRCGKRSEYECSSCGIQGYCSQECQIKDWKYHRLLCQERRS